MKKFIFTLLVLIAPLAIFANDVVIPPFELENEGVELVAKWECYLVTYNCLDENGNIVYQSDPREECFDLELFDMGEIEEIWQIRGQDICW